MYSLLNKCESLSPYKLKYRIQPYLLLDYISCILLLNNLKRWQSILKDPSGTCEKVYLHSRSCFPHNIGLLTEQLLHVSWRSLQLCTSKFSLLLTVKNVFHQHIQGTFYYFFVYILTVLYSTLWPLDLTSKSSCIPTLNVLKWWCSQITIPSILVTSGLQICYMLNDNTSMSLQDAHWMWLPTVYCAVWSLTSKGAHKQYQNCGNNYWIVHRFKTTNLIQL